LGRMNASITRMLLVFPGRPALFRSPVHPP
jgi:hypothetical protein